MGSQLSLGAGQRQGASLGAPPTRHSEQKSELRGGARGGASCFLEGLESAEAWCCSWEGENADSLDPRPHSAFLLGDTCQLPLTRY